MSKLYFYMGSMNSSKSASLLMNVHNYENQGKNVVILKPSINTRDNEGVVSSRVGISHSAIEVKGDDNIIEVIRKHNDKKLDCIFVDEVHMFTVKQIRQLVYVVDELNINVITYGLKNSYIDGKIFDSIQELLFQANAVYEIKSVCTYCNQKATHHLRSINGKYTYTGDEIVVGDTVGEEKYISVCRRHYYNPPK